MDRGQSQSLNYTQFVQKIESDQVATVEISKTDAHGKLKPAPNAAQPQPAEFAAELPQDPFTLGKLTELMLAHHVEIKYPRPLINDTIQNVIFTILIPIAVIGVLWFVFLRQAQSTGNQALSFGRSRAKRLTD